MREWSGLLQLQGFAQPFFAIGRCLLVHEKKLSHGCDPKRGLESNYRGGFTMRHSNLSPAEREADLTRIDQMIAALGRLREANPLMEHLHSARVYLLGAMPEEYLFSIESARQALDVVRDRKLRNSMDDTLSNLIDEMSHDSGD